MKAVSSINQHTGITKTEQAAVKKRALQVLKILKKEYPTATISLRFSNPLELFVAVVLSAQCTDKMVNQVTTHLFKKYRTVNDFADAPVSELEKIIKPLGLYHTKARNIIKACQIMRDNHHSQIPETMDDLLVLPGVARKTANIVLHHAYGKVEGIPVDTHVKRLAQRLGFTLEKDPKKIEMDLCSLIPPCNWGNVNQLLIAHGRKICRAPTPQCQACKIATICPSSLI